MMPEGEAQPRHVLVLDTSKSMLAPMADGSSRKIEVARSALFKILDEVRSQHALFGMVVFNSTASVFLPLSPALPNAEEIAPRLVPTGKSAIWDALALGVDLLRTRTGAVVGNLVLVTDGWDNMSRHFTVYDATNPQGVPQGSVDLVAYMIAPNSQLRLQIIGIGSGSEKDKGVDATRMNALLSTFTERSQMMASVSTASYLEVMRAEDLYVRMVNAFLDMPFEDSTSFEGLSSEDLATHAAEAAHALRESDKHSLVGYLGASKSPAVPEEDSLEFEVALSTQEGLPAHWKERYGPMADVAEACLAKDWPLAKRILTEKGKSIHPLTKAYWNARVSYAMGDPAEAARHLTEAWIEADTLGPAEKAKINRRLALLNAKISGDREVETMVEIFEGALHTARATSPALATQIEGLFDRFLELRRTLAKISDGGAVEHEKRVEEVFGWLQDVRLADKNRDPHIQAFLSFVEVALSEMR